MTRHYPIYGKHPHLCVLVSQLHATCNYISLFLFIFLFKQVSMAARILVNIHPSSGERDIEIDTETHKAGVCYDWIIDDLCCQPALNYWSFGSVLVCACEGTITHLKGSGFKQWTLLNLPCWERRWISTSSSGALTQLTCTLKCLQTATTVEILPAEINEVSHSLLFTTLGALCCLRCFLRERPL